MVEGKLRAFCGIESRHCRLPLDQGLFPDEQPTNNMRTATVKRIVQRREVISHAKRFSILRPDAYMRGGSAQKLGATWPGFLSPLEGTEPQALYFSLCFPPTKQSPPRLPERVVRSSTAFLLRASVGI
jgi:hypothetical protein